MTKPCRDTLESERDKLFITDAELIRRLGVPERVGRTRLRTLDGDEESGFPKKQELWGDRRYWPAVKAYLDTVNQVSIVDAARLIPESRVPHPVAAFPMRAPVRRAHG